MSDIFERSLTNLLCKFLWKFLFTENNPKFWKVHDVEEYFPRYRRHLKAVEGLNSNLVMNIMRVPDLLVSNTNSKFLAGSEYSKLFENATCVDKELRMLNNYVILHFVVANETSHMAQKEINNIISLSPNALWRVFVLQEVMRIDKEDKCSFVLFHNSRECWEHLTSSLELNLIEFIQSCISTKDAENNQDWTLMLERLHSCSSLKKKLQCTTLLPAGLEDALQGNGDSVVRYGFIHDDFFVTVRNGQENQIRKVLQEIISHHSSSFSYTLQTERENAVSLYTRTAQGQKLFRSAEEHKIGRYGTLGCTALLNDENPIAFTCSHVCVEGKDVFVDSHGDIVKLGTCVHSTQSLQGLNIQSDLSIVGITGGEDELGFPVRKAMTDINDEERKVFLLVPPREIKSLQGEQVFKKGASTEWTEGKIIGSQKFSPDWKEAVLVQSLEENAVFAKPGDSGAIVYREGRDALDDRIDIIAIVIGEMQMPDPKKASHLCGYFQDAVLTLTEKYKDIKKISMINPTGEQTILFQS